MAPDLVGRKVDVIIAMGGTPSALATKSANSIALRDGRDTAKHAEDGGSVC